MASIAGFKAIKNTTGKITHVTLSVRGASQTVAKKEL